MMDETRKLWQAGKIFVGGSVVAVLGYGNMICNWLGSGWAFRFLYSPILGTLGLVCFVAGFFLIADVIYPNWEPLNTKRGSKPDAPPCPECGMQLRTKLAKQCRHCGADWH